MKLDHLIYAVPDLRQGIRDVASRLGVAPVPGGRHASVGTHNAILPLRGGTYLELMAPDSTNPSPPLPLPFGLGEDPGPRLVTWAAATSDIDASVAAARAAGFDPGRVADLSRDTPEGEHLAWRLTLSPESFGDGLIPFLIDWADTPHPSRSAETQCSLEDFRGEHPECAAVRKALDALGCEMKVGDGRHARMLATLVGPAGRMELASAPE